MPDTAEKRRSAAGCPALPFFPTTKPNVSKGVAWRQESGWGYSGIPPGPISAPIASFTGTPLSGLAPLTVFYTDLSTGTINLEQFDPGDGSGILAAVPASHVYTSVGSYSPSLFVSGPLGSDTLTRTDYVTVTSPPPPPPPTPSVVVCGLAAVFPRVSGTAVIPEC